MECLKWCLSVSLRSQHAVLRIIPFTCRITTLHLPAVFGSLPPLLPTWMCWDGDGQERARGPIWAMMTEKVDDTLTKQDTPTAMTTVTSFKCWPTWTHKRQLGCKIPHFQNDGDEIGREPEEEEEELLLFLWSALKSYCVYLFLYFYFFLFTKFLKNSVYNLNLERWRRKEKKNLSCNLLGGSSSFWLTFGWQCWPNEESRKG